MRFWIYGHVAAFLSTALFSIAESRGLLVPPRSHWVSIALGIAFPLSLFAMLACPVAVVLQLLARGRASSRGASVVLVEALLTFAQLTALIPMVAEF